MRERDINRTFRDPTADEAVNRIFSSVTDRQNRYPSPVQRAVQFYEARLLRKSKKHERKLGRQIQ